MASETKSKPFMASKTKSKPFMASYRKVTSRYK